ncbi:MAG: FRG domain-containing protein [Bacteroidales bacterium]|nr:FRG domain-containing protein [Bacteroidales bacterium]
MVYKYRYRHEYYIENESHIFNIFKKICKKSEYAKFKLKNSDDDMYYMSIARHLGLKSRLLDWTGDFWVALSFLLYDNLDLDGTLWIMAQRNNLLLVNKSLICQS